MAELPVIQAWEADISGGRVDFLFAPTERFSVRLTAFAQDIACDGSINADFARTTGKPIDGELDQRRMMAEPFDQRFRLASAPVKYAFDFATLTPISRLARRSMPNACARRRYRARR